VEEYKHQDNADRMCGGMVKSLVQCRVLYTGCIQGMCSLLAERSEDKCHQTSHHSAVAFLPSSIQLSTLHNSHLLPVLNTHDIVIPNISIHTFCHDFEALTKVLGGKVPVTRERTDLGTDSGSGPI